MYKGGFGEEDYGEENVGEDDDDKNYEFEEHYVSPEDGNGDDIEEYDVELEEDETLLAGTSSAQSEICLPAIPIVVIDQLFGKDDVDIELRQIYLSKEELAYSLLLFAMRQNFETLIHKSTKSLLVVKCKHEMCGWRIRARKLKDSTFFKISRYM